MYFNKEKKHGDKNPFKPPADALKKKKKRILLTLKMWSIRKLLDYMITFRMSFHISRTRTSISFIGGMVYDKHECFLLFKYCGVLNSVIDKKQVMFVTCLKSCSHYMKDLGLACCLLHVVKHTDLY